MASELPPGIAVGKTGVETARLALQIHIREHRDVRAPARGETRAESLAEAEELVR